MTEPHTNVVTYLAALEAFNRNDIAALAQYIAPDFVYRIPGRATVAGEFHGIDGFVEVLTRLRDESGDTIELTPLTVLADDGNLIARARVTARRGNRRLDTENCYAFRFVDGKVADGQVFLSEPGHVEHFWGTTDESAIA